MTVPTPLGSHLASLLWTFLVRLQYLFLKFETLANHPVVHTEFGH